MTSEHERIAREWLRNAEMTVFASQEDEDKSLATLIAQAEARGPAWQPIEKAPRDKTLFLVGSYHAPYDMALMRGDTLATLMRPGAPRHLTPRAPYTHWMPLPSPPEAAKLKENEGCSSGQ
jgi:hypothetical protein